MRESEERGRKREGGRGGPRLAPTVRGARRPHPEPSALTWRWGGSAPPALPHTAPRARAPHPPRLGVLGQTWRLQVPQPPGPRPPQRRPALFPSSSRSGRVPHPPSVGVPVPPHVRARILPDPPDPPPVPPQQLPALSPRRSRTHLPHSCLCAHILHRSRGGREPRDALGALTDCRGGALTVGGSPLPPSPLRDRPCRWRAWRWMRWDGGMERGAWGGELCWGGTYQRCGRQRPLGAGDAGAAFGAVGLGLRGRTWGDQRGQLEGGSPRL